MAFILNSIPVPQFYATNDDDGNEPFVTKLLKRAIANDYVVQAGCSSIVVVGLKISWTSLDHDYPKADAHRSLSLSLDHF